MVILETLAQSLLKEAPTIDPKPKLLELQREIKRVLETRMIPARGLTSATLMALADLLKFLSENPQACDVTNTRTIYQTARLLASLPRPSPEECHWETSRLRVLVVDDEEVVCRVLAELLGLIGLKVETAGDGPRALELAQQPSWNLFILDILLPTIDGYEVCQRLRKMPSHAHTPVLILTGKNDLDHRMRFARTAANGFVTKPFQSQELLVSALAQLLQSQLERVDADLSDSEVFQSFRALPRGSA